MLLDFKDVCKLNMAVPVYVAQHIFRSRVRVGRDCLRGNNRVCFRGLFRRLRRVGRLNRRFVRTVAVILPFPVLPNHRAIEQEPALFTVRGRSRRTEVYNCRRNRPAVKACFNMAFVEFYIRGAGNARKLRLVYIAGNLCHLKARVRFYSGPARGFDKAVIFGPGFIPGCVKVNRELLVRQFFNKNIGFFRRPRSVGGGHLDRYGGIRFDVFANHNACRAGKGNRLAAAYRVGTGLCVLQGKRKRCGFRGKVIVVRIIAGRVSCVGRRV